MNLRLKDLLWEITPKCNKNCKYCGSKSITSKEPLSDNKIMQIASQIVDYKVETITLTGGEPSTLSDELLTKVINCLADAGCKVKVISNGGIFDKFIPWDKINCVGLSVNFPEECNAPLKITDSERFTNLLSQEPYKATNFEDKITIVTNFGTHNIFHFDQLADIARGFPLWQIQLTMGEYQLNPEGIKYLREKIKNLEGVNYVLSDNLQEEHTCNAGINSCSITYNGDVVACLSERSFCKEQLVSYGNLFRTPLEIIWENEFKDIRFPSDWQRKCCRDCIEYPEEKVNVNTVKIDRIETVPPSDDLSPWVKPLEIQLYGVRTPDIQVYGVGEPQVYAYAVFGKRDCEWTSETRTGRSKSLSYNNNIISYCVVGKDEIE